MRPIIGKVEQIAIEEYGILWRICTEEDNFGLLEIQYCSLPSDRLKADGGCSAEEQSWNKDLAAIGKDLAAIGFEFAQPRHLPQGRLPSRPA